MHVIYVFFAAVLYSTFFLIEVDQPPSAPAPNAEQLTWYRLEVKSGNGPKNVTVVQTEQLILLPEKIAAGDDMVYKVLLDEREMELAGIVEITRLGQGIKPASDDGEKLTLYPDVAGKSFELVSVIDYPDGSQKKEMFTCTLAEAESLRIILIEGTEMLQLKMGQRN